MGAKSFLPIILIALLINVFSLPSITRFSLAQNPNPFKISGYVLDPNGHGIEGAEIIFGVPTIVPSVHSASSGYYEIFAPSGTYHINVWPPFDSNFIYYDQPVFVIGSNATKNITLASGYRVSGYVFASSGRPVENAIVSLDKFFTGYPSNSMGYYFVTAPAGTYRLGVQPRVGYPSFPSFLEYNYVVNGSLAKNITLIGLSSTPSQTQPPSPEPLPSPTSSINKDPSSWPMFHNDLAHSGLSESKGPLTNQTLWKYQTGSSIESSPAIVNGVVYFGSLWNGRSGYVHALNATTGSKIWQYATDSGVESSPAVVGGVVYIGSYSGQVYALDAANGSQIWSFNAGGSVFPSPAVVGGIVYIASATGYVYALNATNGSPLWSHHTGYAIFSSPAVVDGVVYFASEDHNVYALRANDGSRIWNYTTGGSVDISPTVVGGMVYFGSRDGYVYALNATDGSQIWRFLSPYGSGGSYYYSSPAVANGLVYVGSYDGHIYALNAANGGLFWSFRTGKYVFSSPVVAGGVVYVGSFDGNVYALDAMTGGKIWSFQTGDEMRSSAAVANGVVYVGSGDGYLYAFGSPSAQLPPSPTPPSLPTSSAKAEQTQVAAFPNKLPSPSQNPISTPDQPSNPTNPPDLSVLITTVFFVIAVIALPAIGAAMFYRKSR